MKKEEDGQNPKLKIEAITDEELSQVINKAYMLQICEGFGSKHNLTLLSIAVELRERRELMKKEGKD